MLIEVYILAVLVFKKPVMADDQCSEYHFKSPFYPGKSCEDIYNKNPESPKMAGYYWITDGLKEVYCGMIYKGSSCLNIYNKYPEIADKSRHYFINGNIVT